MPTPRRPYANSIDALGFAQFLDSRYPGQGGFTKFEEMMKSGASDKQVAEAFSTEHLVVSRRAAGYWRQRWQEEQAEK